MRPRVSVEVTCAVNPGATGSLGTVKVHLMHIFEKTGVKDRFELAVQGRRLLGTERVPEAASDESRAEKTFA